MKLVPLVLLAATAFAQPKTAFDKVALEAYLRHIELWQPQVAVKIDSPKPSAELPGFDDVMVHLSFNNATKDELYYVSKDGKKIVKGMVYDIQKNPFQSNLDKLKTDGAPAFGPATAPVTMVIFSDFQCPLCKQEADGLRKNLVASYPDKVRVYFKDFPLDQIHNWAHTAAIAGRCVYKLRPDAFWDFHDWIFENQTYIGMDNINTKAQDFAATHGIDGMQLGRCIETKATEPEVAKTMAQGVALGITGTPSVYMNGRKLDGAIPWETMKILIDLELDHAAKVKAAEEKCCEITIPKLVK